jgi:hypothetical protein
LLSPLNLGDHPISFIISSYFNELDFSNIFFNILYSSMDRKHRNGSRHRKHCDSDSETSSTSSSSYVENWSSSSSSSYIENWSSSSSYSSSSSSDYCPYYESVYPTLDTDHVKATSKFSTSFQPWYTCDPSKPLIGNWNGNEWLSAATGDSSPQTNQKFNIDLGSQIVVKRIYYENAISDVGDGWNSCAGVKDYNFYGTNDVDAFNNTTYSNTTNLVLLKSGTFVRHPDSAVEDPHYIQVKNGNSYQYYVFPVSVFYRLLFYELLLLELSNFFLLPTSL